MSVRKALIENPLDSTDSLCLPDCYYFLSVEPAIKVLAVNIAEQATVITTGGLGVWVKLLCRGSLVKTSTCPVLAKHHKNIVQTIHDKHIRRT